jgi:Fe2+ transport system protein FeoA
MAGGDPTEPPRKLSGPRRRTAPPAAAKAIREARENATHSQQGRSDGGLRRLVDLALDRSADAGLRQRLEARGWWSGPLHVRVGMTELMQRRRDAARVSLAG